MPNINARPPFGTRINRAGSAISKIPSAAVRAAGRFGLLPNQDQTVTSDHLPAARAYQGLRSGPNWSRIYETQTGVPIDGSDALSRDPRFGSPFTFRVLPPDALLRSLRTEVGEEKNDVTIIGAASKADSTFRDYTQRLDNLRSSVVTNRSSFNLLENYIAQGKLLNSRNASDPENLVPAVSDTFVAADVVLQLSRILETPPLTLLINPQSLTINHTKKQNYSERSRYDYIFQSWGEEQVKLSVSGRTGAFLAGDPAVQNFVGRATANKVVETATATGVQYASKRNSASFQNLMNLLLFYRNNGYIYDTLGKSEAHLWIGSIAIDYDQWTYVGNFESFEYGYVEEKQNGGLEFSFEFTASRIYDSASRPSGLTVQPIESPVPSPSDTQWSLPNTRNRRPGQGFLGPFEFLRNRSSEPAPTRSGVETPSFQGPFEPQTRGTRGTGLVRGGTF
jgi:hypothetical protein